MIHRENETAGEHGAIIHVNRQHIAMNAKDGGDRPVYTIKLNGPNSTARYARAVMIHGPSLLEYNGSQLNCGARAWIEVPAGTWIELIEPMSFAEARAA